MLNECNWNIMSVFIRSCISKPVSHAFSFCLSSCTKRVRSNPVLRRSTRYLHTYKVHAYTYICVCVCAHMQIINLPSEHHLLFGDTLALCQPSAPYWLSCKWETFCTKAERGRGNFSELLFWKHMFLFPSFVFFQHHLEMQAPSSLHSSAHH